jgi:hypothetical protein
MTQVDKLHANVIYTGDKSIADIIDTEVKLLLCC